MFSYIHKHYGQLWVVSKIFRNPQHCIVISWMAPTSGGKGEEFGRLQVSFHPCACWQHGQSFQSALNETEWVLQQWSGKNLKRYKIHFPNPIWILLADQTRKNDSQHWETWRILWRGLPKRTGHIRCKVLDSFLSVFLRATGRDSVLYCKRYMGTMRGFLRISSTLYALLCCFICLRHVLQCIPLSLVPMFLFQTNLWCLCCIMYNTFFPGFFLPRINLSLKVVSVHL